MYAPGQENLFCLRNSEAHPPFRPVVADNGWLSMFFVFVFIFNSETHRSVQLKLTMGGCLDFVELGDVVEDRDEDNRQDVHVTAADLSSNFFCKLVLMRRQKGLVS